MNLKVSPNHPGSISMLMLSYWIDYFLKREVHLIVCEKGTWLMSSASCLWAFMKLASKHHHLYKKNLVRLFIDRNGRPQAHSVVIVPIALTGRDILARAKVCSHVKTVAVNVLSRRIEWNRFALCDRKYPYSLTWNDRQNRSFRHSNAGKDQPQEVENPSPHSRPYSRIVPPNFPSLQNLRQTSQPERHGRDGRNYFEG